MANSRLKAIYGAGVAIGTDSRVKVAIGKLQTSVFILSPSEILTFGILLAVGSAFFEAFGEARID